MDARTAVLRFSHNIELCILVVATRPFFLSELALFLPSQPFEKLDPLANYGHL